MKSTDKLRLQFSGFYCTAILELAEMQGLTPTQTVNRLIAIAHDEAKDTNHDDTQR